MSTPELELNEDEAKKFAASLARVSSLYDDRINPKLVAWIDIACVAGAIYGPRAIAISARLKTEASSVPARPGPTPIRRTANAPAQPQAKSPVDMFGPEYFGATIPDAV